MNAQSAAKTHGRSMTCCCFIAPVLALYTAAFAAPEYALVEVSPLPGYDSLRPRDINDEGQVTGSMFKHDPPDIPDYLHRGFMWQTGVVHELAQLPGYRSADAWEINEYGVIVGRQFVTNELETGSVTVTWGESGVTNVSPSHDTGRLAFECAINSSSCIAGVWSPAVNQSRAFAVIDGYFHSLGTLGSTSKASGMNDSNLVVGTSWSYAASDWRGFLWSETTGMIELDTLTDESGLASAHAVNNQGMIIGQRVTNGWARAYSYLQGTVTDLGVFDGGRSSPHDLNDSGLVVGTADIVETIAPGIERRVNHASVYNMARGMRDLNELIPADSGWVLDTATAVNNHGEIVGFGRFNGQSSAFLLKPVPGISLTAIGDGLVTVSLSRLVPRTTYVIQRSETLSPSEWNDATTFVAEANSYVWSEPFLASSDRVFFRVIGQ